MGASAKSGEVRDTSLDQVTMARFENHYLFTDSDFLLARARAVTAAHALPYLSEFGLNPGSYFLLALTSGEANPTVSELSQILLVSEAEAEVLVDDLERLFLLSRRPDPRSKGGIVVKATPQGEDLFAKVRRLLGSTQSDPMSQLSLAQRKQLTELLARLAF